MRRFVTALVHTLDNYSELKERATRQDNNLSTYAKKMEKTESIINWKHKAQVVNYQIRACYSRHPAYSILNGSRIRILAAVPVEERYEKLVGSIVQISKNCVRIACAESALDVYRVQLPGKKAVNVTDILNSKKEFFSLGDRLSQDENPS